MGNGAFDVTIKNTSKAPYNSNNVYNTDVYKDKTNKDTRRIRPYQTKEAMQEAMPRWSYNEKFTHLEKSLEEIMEALL